MKELQQLINYSEGQRDKALQKVDKYLNVNDEMYMFHSGIAWALSQIVAHAELLLKKAESKQPETAPFANTMFGEVPPGGDVEHQTGDSSFMGATRAVRQNEWTE